MIELIQKKASINLTTSSSTDTKEAYDKGHEAGYHEGYGDGFFIGNNVGYDKGQKEGYESGYSVGNTEGYEAGYEQGHEAGYDSGYEVGTDDTTDKFNHLYTAGTIQGNNSTVLTIPCPFKPDAVILQHYHPLWATTDTNSVVLWQGDFRAFATQVGMIKYKKGTSNAYAHIGAKTIDTYINYKDGTITFTVPSTSSMSGVNHKDFALYNYSCVKYTAEDDYSLLMGEIMRLSPKGGEIQFSEKRVKEAIEEAIANNLVNEYTNWEDVWRYELITIQPKWTFTLG